MIVGADLTLELAGETARRHLQAVLTPDNGEAPRGLKLGLTGEGETLRLTVESGSPSSTISTALAVLRDAALFQEIWLLSRTRRA